jgi:hypothetical protein
MPHDTRRDFLRLLAAGTLLPARLLARQAAPLPAGIRLDTEDGVWQVTPPGRIQDALELAAQDAAHKRVVVHPGVYRPAERGQALIWFNARHDGIVLEAAGDVTLTAANPDLSDPVLPSHPAVVNHVVYFGDGISPKTIMRGFRVTGARNYTSGSGERSPIEADEIRKTPFFFADGGGLKIYARSYPTIERVVVEGNYTSPCGGGVSVEHLGPGEGEVTFRDCIFRDNRTQITGSAVDVLHYSRVSIENCLFVGNVANLGVDYVGMLSGGEYHPENGSGALTVFEGGRAIVTRCTFTANWNGVDDNGEGSRYTDSIFWKNTRRGGIAPGPRYEIDITRGEGVRGCLIHGETNDLRGTISREANTFDAPDPGFDAAFVPTHAAYAKAGYRPNVSAGSPRSQR